MADKNIIPPMAHELGRHWIQPARESILIDDTHAVMDSTAFKNLPEYSASTPSGVYPGKMWKRHDGLFDRTCKPEDRRWLLCWFGEVEGRLDICSNNYREILEVDQ